jgi:cell division protein FtsL
MVLHRIVINIKLPIFLLTLLVLTKKKDKKLKFPNKILKNKKIEHQKKKDERQIEYITSKMD